MSKRSDVTVIEAVIIISGKVSRNSSARVQHVAPALGHYLFIYTTSLQQLEATAWRPRGPGIQVFTCSPTTHVVH